MVGREAGGKHVGRYVVGEKSIEGGYVNTKVVP